MLLVFLNMYSYQVLILYCDQVFVFQDSSLFQYNMNYLNTSIDIHYTFSKAIGFKTIYNVLMQFRFRSYCQFECFLTNKERRKMYRELFLDSKTS